MSVILLAPPVLLFLALQGVGTTLLPLDFLGILVLWALICSIAFSSLKRYVKTRKPKVQDATVYAEELHEVTRSRREIAQAFEIERQRIERDLHDGAQQFIVAASMKVGEAKMVLDDLGTEPSASDRAELSSLLTAAQDAMDGALTELRRTVAGIHPRVLTDVGLEAAVRDVASRSGLNVSVRVPNPLPDLPEGVAASAYFLVSEALTNVSKHARSASVTVLVAADQDLHVTVVDTGPGGASFQAGRGLAGMRERLRAFGGTLELSSPPGGPTSVTTRLPLLLLGGEPSVPISSEDPK